MQRIGDCCEGRQIPQPKVQIKTPTYNALYGNPQTIPDKAEKKPIKQSSAVRKG